MQGPHRNGASWAASSALSHVLIGMPSATPAAQRVGRKGLAGAQEGGTSRRRAAWDLTRFAGSKT